MESIIRTSRQRQWPLQMALCSSSKYEYVMSCSYNTSIITAVRSLYSVFMQVMGQYCSGCLWQHSLGISTVLPFTSHVGILSGSPSSISHMARLRSSAARSNCFHQKLQMPSHLRAFQLLAFLLTSPDSFINGFDISRTRNFWPTVVGPVYKCQIVRVPRPFLTDNAFPELKTSSADGCWELSGPSLVPLGHRQEGPCLR